MGPDPFETRLIGEVAVVVRHPDTGAVLDFRADGQPGRWPASDGPRCGECNQVLRITQARAGVVLAHVHGGSAKPREVVLNWEAAARRQDRPSNLPPGFRDRDAASVPDVSERG